MKIISSITILFFVLSFCTSKSNFPVKRIESDLRVYLLEQGNLKRLAFTIDSIRFIRLDTITEKLRLYRKIVMMENEYDKIFEEYTKVQNEAETNTQLLASSRGVSRAVRANYLAQAKKNMETMNKIVNQLDTKRNEINIIDSVAANADSTTLLAYNIVYLFQLTQKDRTIFKDTGFAVANIDYRLLNSDQFFKK